MLCILAALAPTWGELRSQERTPPRTTGRVLLLQNLHALEGDIERVGEQYRIRRTAGELWVPADKVVRLCADWDEAFALVCRQGNLHDPDERLRLARWCQMNGLLKQALAQVTVAVRMRPEHAESKHLLTLLQRTADQARTAPPAPGQPLDQGPTAPPVDLSSESLTLFTTRVQPILMNACAGCHATGRGGKFKLSRCYDASLNRRGLHQNLAAVLEHIDLERPAMSPLLYKSVSAHGASNQAPLPGRQSVPFQTLQEWVEMVVVNNPHLRRQLSDSRGNSGFAAPRAGAEGPPRRLPAGESEKLPGPAATAAPKVGTPPAPTLTLETASPSGPAPAPAAVQQPSATPEARQRTPIDEHDAWIFNHQLHPDR